MHFLLFRSHNHLCGRYYLHFTGENTKDRAVLWFAQGLTAQHDQCLRDRGGDPSTTRLSSFPAFSFELPWRDTVEPDPSSTPLTVNSGMAGACLHHLHVRFLPSPLGNRSLTWISILIPFLRYLFIREVWKGLIFDPCHLSGITLPGLGQRRKWGLYIQAVFISGTLVII